MNKINITWIIDDDPIQVFIAKRMLHNIGFSKSILSWGNGKKALEELNDLTTSTNSNFPDIIFVDINMPQMDGWQFLEELDKMSLKNKINIYLVTSSIDPGDVQRAESCKSLSGYLIKPVKTENLAEILHKYEEQ